MKKFSVLAIFVVFLFSATSVYAVPTPPQGVQSPNYLGVFLDDGAGHTGYVLSQTGVATFTGALGDWTVNVTTAITYPTLGTTSNPEIDLNSVNASSSTGGTLQIYASASGFLPPSLTGQTQFVFDVGGTTAGSVQYKLYWDNFPNYLFWTGYGSIMDSGVISNSPFSDTFGGDIPANAVDYTLFAQIIHTGAGATSFDGDLSTVPEPATMLLLGSGLLGMGVYARRRFIK